MIKEVSKCQIWAPLSHACQVRRFKDTLQRAGSLYEEMSKFQMRLEKDVSEVLSTKHKKAKQKLQFAPRKIGIRLACRDLELC